MYHASETAAGPSSSAPPAGPATAAVLTAIVAFVVMIGIASRPALGRMAPLAIAETMLVLVPVLWFWQWLGASGARVRDMLGLRRPAAPFLSAALLVGASQWIWNLAIATALAPYLPAPTRGLEQLSQIATQPPIVVSFLGLALVPAVAEEIAFRGVLARGLATRFWAPVAIGVSALTFATFHLSPAQFAPTFSLGIVYGLLAIRSRSAVPSMIAHFVNNAMAVLASRELVQPIFAALVRSPAITISCAIGVTVAGIALILRGDRRE